MSTEEAKKLISNALAKDDLRILMKELSIQEQDQTKELDSNDYQNKNSRKFVCCVDGTENGDITFHTMTHLMRKRDYIAVLHSPDDVDGKGTTFDDPSGMKHHYESQLLKQGVPSGNILFQVETKGNYNILTILQRYMSLFHSHQKLKVNTASPTILDSSFVYEIPPDFIFLGDDSWKGQNSTHTVPSSSDLVMRTFHIPCVICKKRFSNLNQQLTTNAAATISGTSVSGVEQLCYVMAIDDSQTSFNGLEILLQLLKSSDRLILIHVHYPLEAVPLQYLNSLESGGVGGMSKQSLRDNSMASPTLPTGGSVRQGGGLSQLLANTSTNSNTNKEEKSNPPTLTDLGTSSASTVPSLPGPSSARRHSHSAVISSMNSQTKYYPLTTEVREQYLELLREYGPRVAKSTSYDQMIVEMAAPSTDIQAIRGQLVDYVNQVSPDFFAIAPKSQRKLTSFTEFILTEVNTSVILCKN
jgi:hypothetical protein